MYKKIMVALDNSEWSGHGMALAIELARLTGARVTGNHVYAARLHGERFRQLEPGLPERFHQSEALERLRRIHGDLIGRGLGIISDSYLDVFEQRCREAGVEWKRKALEGRHYAELVKDARDSAYDLLVVGAYGLGWVDRSTLGSVCERVARLVECDLLVARNGRSPGQGELVVAIDGSDHSFAALKAALGLTHLYGSRVQAVAAYDPFFHGGAFSSLAGVLSGEAARLFRFREQESLHGEIIDTGLESVYRSHLERAQAIAERQGIALRIEVLEGKPFDAVASHCERVRPSLLVVGRVGMHHADGVTLGSTAENLLRAVDCNVLVVNRGVGGSGTEAAPSGASQSGGPEIQWDQEAERRLERVPRLVRRMARGRIEAFARERGHRVITLEVYEEARRHFGM